MKKLFPIAVGLMLVLFLVFFRTAAGVILPAGIIVLSVIWTMGLAGIVLGSRNIHVSLTKRKQEEEALREILLP